MRKRAHAEGQGQCRQKRASNMAESTDAEASLNKKVYKGFVLVVKYIPFITAFCYMLNTELAYIGLTFEPLSNLAGMSLTTWLFLYIASIAFKFCIYHRLFLWYIFADDTLNIVDYYITIPVSTDNLLMLHNILLGLVLFTVLYVYVRHC